MYYLSFITILHTSILFMICQDSAGVFQNIQYVSSYDYYSLKVFKIKLLLMLKVKVQCFI